MTPHLLASILRERQLAYPIPADLIPAGMTAEEATAVRDHSVRTCSDAEMIDSYVTCSHCGFRPSDEDLAEAIAMAETYDDFCRLTAHDELILPIKPTCKGTLAATQALLGEECNLIGDVEQVYYREHEDFRRGYRLLYCRELCSFALAVERAFRAELRGWTRRDDLLWSPDENIIIGPMERAWPDGTPRYSAFANGKWGRLHHIYSIEVCVHAIPGHLLDGSYAA